MQCFKYFFALHALPLDLDVAHLVWPGARDGNPEHAQPVVHPGVLVVLEEGLDLGHDFLAVRPLPVGELEVGLADARVLGKGPVLDLTVGQELVGSSASGIHVANPISSQPDVLVGLAASFTIEIVDLECPAKIENNQGKPKKTSKIKPHQ